MTFDGVSWSQPINLTPDDRVHQHAAAIMTPAGEFIVVNQSPAVASRRMRALGIGRSAGPLIGTNLDLMTQSIRRVADPGISYCRISDPFAGPGAKVHATIGITNHGFASTPTQADQSTLALKAIYLFPDGRRKEVLRRMCPIINAGGETMLSFDLTMPRTPVKVSFEVDPVEGELDPADNVRLRSLGTQPPESPTAKFLRSSKHGEAVLLRWTNAGLYDRILFYRDGKMVTELPGSATSHVDRGAGLLNQPGLLARHEYALRGVRGESRSIPATCIFIKPTEGATFRRADANSDGNVDLSDGVFVLNYLFTGGRKPQCLKAADTNDSGLVDISDGIYVLTFLFLGGKAPPAPFLGCGEDLTPDTLTCDTQPASCKS
jgi:hypothetical protein